MRYQENTLEFFLYNNSSNYSKYWEPFVIFLGIGPCVNFRCKYHPTTLHRQFKFVSKSMRTTIPVNVVWQLSVLLRDVLEPSPHSSRFHLVKTWQYFNSNFAKYNIKIFCLTFFCFCLYVYVVPSTINCLNSKRSFRNHNSLVKNNKRGTSHICRLKSAT